MSAMKAPHYKIDVPVGYLFVHEKWRGSTLAQEVHKKSKGCCYEDLGIVDFLPSSDCPVVYLNEADLLCASSSKAKVKSLAKEYPKCRCVIIMMQSPSTLESFSDIQKVAVIHHSLAVLPITSSNSIPDILMQMIRMETISPENPFKVKKKRTESCGDREKQIELLSTIPKIKGTNAVKLLKLFGTITAISNASYPKLTAVVGNSAAKSVLDFFHGGGKVVPK